MDRINNPISIQQPGLVTPRAPHYREEERKRQPSDRPRHDDEEENEDPEGVASTFPDSDSSVGTKIDIHI